MLRRAGSLRVGLIVLGAVGAGTLLSSGESSSADRVAAVCDRVASPPAHGRRAHVVRTLLRSLRRGQTGCLRGGTYFEDVTVSRGRVVLRSHPGERARIVGRLWIRRNAHDVVIRNLALDGRNDEHLPSPTVNGDRARFVAVDVTNRHTGICFIIGSRRYGRASGTVIKRSRIHDCGRLPSTNEDHGIYVSNADDTRIVGNLIHDNADRGIQLFPDAQRTRIAGNVIDGNGEGIIFSGGGGFASSRTIVEHNAISYSRIRADVEAWYPGDNPVGVGNVVRENCVYGGRGGTIDDLGWGFTAADNLIADPGYADREAGDYRIDPGARCARLLLRATPHPAVLPRQP